jgi:hypothetical protein
VTDSSHLASPAAGWYPITPGSPQLRWWDGTQWTDQFHTVGVTPVPSDRAPEGTRPYTVWIWILAVLPLLQLAELPLLTSVYHRILSAGIDNPSSISAIELSPSSGYFVVQGLGLVILAISVVLAVLDYRALKARGLPRPFHWAWTFLSALVYVIGRSVVARRRTGSGLAPMLVNIIAVVVSIVGVLLTVIPPLMEAISSVN